MNFSELTSKIIGKYNRIIPPVELLQLFSQLSEEEQTISHQILGLSNKGHSIDIFSIGQGKHNTLWYGFPDPGEAVGGTVIYLLMKSLISKPTFLLDLDVQWHFIPCLNFDDQPNDGNTVEKIMKTTAQEVDWILDNPRPETTAIVNCAKELSPMFSYPLHDEYHCEEKDIPVYFPVSESIEPDTTEDLRNIVQKYGLRISKDIQDSEMGDGFFLMNTVKDFPNSTFSLLAKSGLVFICEIPDSDSISINNLLKAQLECGLRMLDYSLKRQNQRKLK